MSAQRQIFRFAAQLRAPAARSARSPMQRRFASTSTSTGTGGGAGAEKNAFVREREAIKEHAASTTELWRKISIYGIPPALLLAGLNAYNQWTEHWEHWEHLPPLEERVEYPYQNMRTKNYTWGDGDKTLFWNDSVNYHNKDKTT